MPYELKLLIQSNEKQVHIFCEPVFDYFLQTLKLHGEGVADAVEGIVDLLAERGHNSDNDDGDERENDRVLNETLAFFFGSE